MGLDLSGRNREGTVTMHNRSSADWPGCSMKRSPQGMMEEWLSTLGRRPCSPPSLGRRPYTKPSALGLRCKTTAPWVRVKGEGQGCGSRVRVKDEGQGRGSRVRVKGEGQG